MDHNPNLNFKTSSYFFGLKGGFRIKYADLIRTPSGVEIINWFAPYADHLGPRLNFYATKSFSKVGRRARTSLWNRPQLAQYKKPTTSAVFISDNDYSIRWHCNLDFEWSPVNSWSGDLRVNPEREGSSAQRSGDDRQRKLYLSGSPGLPVFLPAQQVLGGAPSCKVP